MKLKWQNSFAESLPADSRNEKASRQVVDCCYSLVTPTQVSAPKLLAWSNEAASKLLLEKPDIDNSPESASELLNILSGNLVTEQMKPFAARYGGHQFGHWAGQLGDGRAITLGELPIVLGGTWELQLKGAGPTPYSRRADGRAVLRSSVREFLCSESMFYLGVPTTRALSLVATGDGVERDMFYNGNPQIEPGAIVARVAPSFVRFGNFQILTEQGEIENLRALANYVIQKYYPEFFSSTQEMTAVNYGDWFKEVCVRTAHMIVQWMRVGFVHGVMNTDNMSILGLTIDYGPYGFLDNYDPNWTPNTTDYREHRYCYSKQPSIGLWNLIRLAEALHPLIPEVPVLESAIDGYRTEFESGMRNMMLRKLGVPPEQLGSKDSAILDADQLVAELLVVLEECEIDWTLFFNSLLEVVRKSQVSALIVESCLDDFSPAFYSSELTMAGREKLGKWLREYLSFVERYSGLNSISDRIELMAKTNPQFILRNYISQNVIDGLLNNDESVLNQVTKALKDPYQKIEGCESLYGRRPDWAKNKPGCSALSCSS